MIIWSDYWYHRVKRSFFSSGLYTRKYFRPTADESTVALAIAHAHPRTIQMFSKLSYIPASSPQPNVRKFPEFKNAFGSVKVVKHKQHMDTVLARLDEYDVAVNPKKYWMGFDIIE